MKDHERIPTGEKLHNCTFCDHATTVIGNMKQHLRTHGVGEKVYKCKLCGFLNKTLSGLKKHKMSHTGEKPVKCKVCNFASITIQELKVHMKIKHHIGVSLKCSLCSVRITSSGQLWHHRKKHAGTGATKVEK